MGIKLFIAGITILVALAVVPFFNVVLEELIETHLISHFGWENSDYRTAFWRIFPIIIGGYLLVVLPIQILAKGAFRRRQGPDDFNKPE